MSDEKHWTLYYHQNRGYCSNGEAEKSVESWQIYGLSLATIPAFPEYIISELKIFYLRIPKFNLVTLKQIMHIILDLTSHMVVGINPQQRGYLIFMVFNKQTSGLKPMNAIG